MTNAEVLDLCATLGVAAKGPSSSLAEAYADMVTRRAERDGLTRAEQPEEPKVDQEGCRRRRRRRRRRAAEGRSQRRRRPTTPPANRRRAADRRSPARGRAAAESPAPRSPPRRRRRRRRSLAAGPAPVVEAPTPRVAAPRQPTAGTAPSTPAVAAAGRRAERQSRRHPAPTEPSMAPVQSSRSPHAPAAAPPAVAAPIAEPVAARRADRCRASRRCVVASDLERSPDRRWSPARAPPTPAVTEAAPASRADRPAPAPPERPLSPSGKADSAAARPSALAERRADPAAARLRSSDLSHRRPRWSPRRPASRRLHASSRWRPRWARTVPVAAVPVALVVPVAPVAVPVAVALARAASVARRVVPAVVVVVATRTICSRSSPRTRRPTRPSPTGVVVIERGVSAQEFAPKLNRTSGRRRPLPAEQRRDGHGDHDARRRADGDVRARGRRGDPARRAGPAGRSRTAEVVRRLRRRRRPGAAAAGHHRDGPRRPRQDHAARPHPRRPRRRRRGRWHHPAHRRLPGATTSTARSRSSTPRVTPRSRRCVLVAPRRPTSSC